MSSSLGDALFIHPKPRLINAVVYPDGTCIYMDGLAVPGTYVEGVRTEILDDDGSKEWAELHGRVQREGQVAGGVRWLRGDMVPGRPGQA